VALQGRGETVAEPQEQRQPSRLDRLIDAALRAAEITLRVILWVLILGLIAFVLFYFYAQSRINC
jgi:hypothetical protein